MVGSAHSQMMVCQQQLLLHAGFDVANTACRALQNHTSTVASCDQAAQLPRMAQQTCSTLGPVKQQQIMPQWLHKSVVSKLRTQ